MFSRQAWQIGKWSPRRRLGLATALVLLMALLLGLLYLRADSVAPHSRNSVMLNLRELASLDAQWDANILRAQIGRPSSNPQFEAGVQRMHDIMTDLSVAQPDPAHQAYAQLRTLLLRKEQLVADYARRNQSLRAALRHLPPAIADLKSDLVGIEGALAPGRIVLRLDTSLNALLTETLRYNITPDPGLAEKIDTILGDVAAQQIAFLPGVIEKMDAVIASSRTIVAQRPAVNRLEDEIDALATDQALDRVELAFDKGFDTALLEHERLRAYLFAYTALLLALLAFAGWRLRRSYRIIGEVNRRLHGVNATLEQRVAERTAELEAQSQQLERLAQHDSLTGLINYRQLTRLLERAMVRAGRRDSVVVLMFIDLDGFKAVNDTWGHATGDLVLQMVARRVREKLRAEDALARLGGDEFVILLEEVASREGALRVARLVLERIESITEADGSPVQISASIGIASARGKSGLARGQKALLAAADKAMYAAKQAGKGRFSVSPEAQWLDLVEPGAQESGANGGPHR